MPALSSEPERVFFKSNPSIRRYINRLVCFTARLLSYWSICSHYSDRLSLRKKIYLIISTRDEVTRGYELYGLRKLWINVYMDSWSKLVWNRIRRWRDYEFCDQLNSDQNSRSWDRGFGLLGALREGEGGYDWRLNTERDGKTQDGKEEYTMQERSNEQFHRKLDNETVSLVTSHMLILC